jgi:hypothetical protein
MFSQWPLAELPTDPHDRSGWTAPGTSLCLHGVPVPSRVLGFSVAWHRHDLADRELPAPAPAPKPLRLVRVEHRRRSTDGPTTTAAA